jgi:transcriptional regulator with GAF, ATPase, and Fis domain
MSQETPRQTSKVKIRQYQTLLEISEAIASDRDLTSLFHNLAQHLRAVVEFDWVSTLLYDPAHDVMRIHMLEPNLPDGLIGPPEMPVDDVPSGWVWKTQEPLIIRDAAQETRFPRIGEWARVAEQQAKRQSDRLQLLLNLNNAIASALDLPALFRAVSASLRQVFHHDFAVMGLYDEQKKELRAYAMDGADGLSFLEEGMLVPLDGPPPRAGH